MRRMEKQEFKVGQTYELNSQEAAELCHQGYVFVRTDGKEHNEGKPSIRQYQFLGRW